MAFLGWKKNPSHSFNISMQKLQEKLLFSLLLTTSKNLKYQNFLYYFSKLTTQNAHPQTRFISSFASRNEFRWLFVCKLFFFLICILQGCLANLTLRGSILPACRKNAELAASWCGCLVSRCVLDAVCLQIFFFFFIWMCYTFFSELVTREKTWFCVLLCVFCYRCVQNDLFIVIFAFF